MRFQVGEALASLGETNGMFDVVYCDVDKQSYPDAWRAARERIRLGGLYICDNVLWSGYVVDSSSEEDPHAELTEAIREHNRLISQDERYLSTIVPTRDGVMVALRVPYLWRSSGRFAFSSITGNHPEPAALGVGVTVFTSAELASSSGLVRLVRQFSLNCDNFSLRFYERGYRAAHLRDQFVKGRGVQFAIPPLYPGRGSATPKISIAEKVNRKLTAQATRSLDVAQERLIAALLASPSQTDNIFPVGWPRHLPSTSFCGRDAHAPRCRQDEGMEELVTAGLSAHTARIGASQISDGD